MTRKLHIVLGCTNRKTSASLRSARLGSFSGPRRLERWQKHLEAAPRTIRADNMYAGEAWREGLKTAETARERFDTTVWILSGGFGLIREDHLLCPYSATLTPGHADSVARSGALRRRDNRLWMTALSQWRGPAAPGDPRTIAEVVAQHPDGHVLICVGPVYVDAVLDDIREAARLASPSGSLLVLASTRTPPDGLAANWIHTPGRLRTTLGGSLASVSTRVAQEIVRDTSSARGLTAAQARTTVHRLVSTSTALPTYGRVRMSDDQALGWIASHLEDEPDATASSALRAFRRSGHACEQTRFGRLFAAVESPRS